MSEFRGFQYGPFPNGLTAGPDGNLWFAESFSVQRVSPATPGSVTTIPIPTGAHFAVDIAAGPDGNLWFTASQIGRVTPGISNTVTEFTIPSTPAGGSVEPWGITAGPDGNLWFTERTGNAIGRITPGSPNTITEFPLPTPGAGPAGITVGCDGGLWFTEFDAGQIGRIDPQSPNTIQEYALPTAFAGPTDIVAGPKQDLWFTEYLADRIGRVRLRCLSYRPWRRIFVPNNFDEWWRLHGNPLAVSVLGNLLYLPAKAGFAVAGGAAGGLAYAATLGNLDAAMTIWRDAMRGDYVVTPDMVRRGTAPRFVGSDQRYVARRLPPPAFLPLPGRSTLPPKAAHRLRSGTHSPGHGAR